MIYAMKNKYIFAHEFLRLNFVRFSQKIVFATQPLVEVFCMYIEAVKIALSGSVAKRSGKIEIDEGYFFKETQFCFATC